MTVPESVTSAYTAAASPRSAVASDTRMLSKESFLKLLITQLKYQNPLEPVSNTDFVAQMAQFSSLEELQNVSKTLAEIKTLEENRGKESNLFSGMAALLSGTSLLGREIEFLNAAGERQKGKVDAVRMEGGQPLFLVGKEVVDFSRVVQVQEASQSQSGMTAAATAQTAGGISVDQPDRQAD